MNIVRESAVSVVNSWSNRIEAEGGVADIEIDECMRNFSGNVISKACFGSNYDKSEEIFLKFVALQELLSWKNIFRLIPGMRCNAVFPCGSKNIIVIIVLSSFQFKINLLEHVTATFH